MTPIVTGPIASLTKDVPQNKGVPDPEVQQRAKRRTFTQKYKDNILQQAQSCTEHGQMGALLRREGLYSNCTDDFIDLASLLGR